MEVQHHGAAGLLDQQETGSRGAHDVLQSWLSCWLLGTPISRGQAHGVLTGCSRGAQDVLHCWLPNRSSQPQDQLPHAGGGHPVHVAPGSGGHDGGGGHPGGEHLALRCVDRPVSVGGWVCATGRLPTAGQAPRTRCCPPCTSWAPTRCSACPGASHSSHSQSSVAALQTIAGRLPVTWYRDSYTQQLPMTDMRMRADGSYPGGGLVWKGRGLAWCWRRQRGLAH